MPAISTFEICELTYGTNQFTSMVQTYEAIDPPEWFNMGPPQINEFTGEATYTYQVTGAAPIGVHEIQIGDGQYITVTVIDCAIIINICIGDIGMIGPIDPPPGEENYYNLFGTSLPEDILFDVETQTLSYAISEVGTYYATLLAEFSSDWLVYKFIVTNCYEEYNPCETGESNYPVNIAWYNRLGGWQSYVFYSRQILKKQIGQVNEFKATGNIKKKISIQDIYNEREVPSGLIPRSHLDYVEEMKYTIQAYLCNDATDWWDIPILIDADSFVVRQEGNGFHNYDFNYIYATEIMVQGQ